MESSGNYLLKKIVESNEKYLPTMGRFHAQHFDDVAEIMQGFAEDTVIDVVKRLNEGEDIFFRGMTLSLKKPSGGKKF